jgi:hypothetical protein
MTRTEASAGTVAYFCARSDGERSNAARRKDQRAETEPHCCHPSILLEQNTLRQYAWNFCGEYLKGDWQWLRAKALSRDWLR